MGKTMSSRPRSAAVLASLCLSWVMLSMPLRDEAQAEDAYPSRPIRFN